MQRKSSGWVWLLGGFFLLAVFDGALRKWVVPNQSLALYLLKDVTLAGAFVLYVVTKHPLRFPQPLRRGWFSILLGIYVFVVIIQALNFTQPNVAVRMLGLKAHLAYLPLLVLLPALVASLQRWAPEKIIMTYVGGVALPVMLLGIYQFFQPGDAWINRYAADTEFIAGVSGFPRITGTFAYISGMTSFMLFNTLLGFGTLVGGMMSKRRWLTWFGAIFLVLCIVVLPMSGSRGPVYFAVLLITGIGFLLLQRQRGGTSVLLGAVLAFGMVAIIFTQSNLGEGWNALWDRIEVTTDEEGRIKDILHGPMRGIERAGLFGYGVGSLHQAAPQLVSEGEATHWWIPGGYVEYGVERIILELGIIGWVVLLALKLTIAWMAYQALQRAGSAFEVIVAVVALGKGVLHIVFPVVFDVTSAITYWTAVGLLLYVWSYQQVRASTRSLQTSRSEIATSALR